MKKGILFHLDTLFLLVSALMGSFVLAIILDILIPADVQFLAPGWLTVFERYIFIPGAVVFFTSWTIWSIARVCKRRRKIIVQKGGK